MNKYLKKIFKYTVIISIITFSCVFSLEILSRYVIDWNKYEKEITEHLEEIFGKGKVTISNIEGTLLMPKVMLYNTYLEYNEENSNVQSNNISLIPQIEMRLSIFSFLIWEPKIDSMLIKSIDIYPFHIKKILANSSAIAKIHKINIDEGKIKLNSNFFHDIAFKKLSLNMGKDLSMMADLIVRGQIYKAKFIIDGKQKNFTITSDSLKVNFQGVGEQGKVNIQRDKYCQ